MTPSAGFFYCVSAEAAGGHDHSPSADRVSVSIQVKRADEFADLVWAHFSLAVALALDCPVYSVKVRTLRS